MPERRSRLVLPLLSCLLGCGGAQRVPPTPPASKEPPAAKLGARHIDTQEEADSARQDLDYLGEDAAREPLLRELVHFYSVQAEQALARGHAEDAYEAFSAALQLFPAQTLQDPRRPPKAPAVLRLAQDIERAFRRRGSHQEVACALMVQRTLAPGDGGAAARYDELAAWLAGTPGRRLPWRADPRAVGARADPPAGDVPASLIRGLEATAKLWPSWAVIDELTALYLAEAQGVALGEGRLRGLRDMLSGGRPSGPSLPAFRLARLYLRVPRREDAVRVVQRLGQRSRLSPPERSLLGIMETALAPNADPGETVKLAMAMAQSPEDGDVALALCQDLARRSPRTAAAHLCVGELAVRQQRTGLAIRAFEQARALTPGERPVWERLGQLYLMRLSDLVGDERTAELEGALRQIEAYQERMKQAFPDQPASQGMAAALSEVGRGYYNAGRIDDAVRFLDRSVQLEPNAVALELLGTIQLKRGRAQEALATLERARAVELASSRGDPLFKVYFRAHIGRLIADAMDLLGGERHQAQELRRACVKDWEQLLGSDRLVPDRRAEAELERGKLLYELGDRDGALAALRAAVDAVPEEGQGKSQGQVYADTISFLAQRGEVDDAIDAYHRALGRAKLVEYLKVYCSLWVNDLLLRSGQQEDPLATAFLRSLKGGKWYAELARWATGQEGEEELLRRADTVGQRAEANFYLGLQRMRAGQTKRGQELFQRVIESEMMAFFEYEMAAYYLRRGVPTQPVLKSAPKPPPPKKEPKRPAGSI